MRAALFAFNVSCAGKDPGYPVCPELEPIPIVRARSRHDRSRGTPAICRSTACSIARCSNGHRAKMMSAANSAAGCHGQYARGPHKGNRILGPRRQAGYEGRDRGLQPVAVDPNCHVDIQGGSRFAPLRYREPANQHIRNLRCIQDPGHLDERRLESGHPVRLSSPRISCMRRTPRRSGSRSSSRTDSESTPGSSRYRRGSDRADFRAAVVFQPTARLSIKHSAYLLFCRRL
jgi:hypothetical protein